jgi:predicted negative regulator of RcsB-dependent stress response
MISMEWWELTLWLVSAFVVGMVLGVLTIAGWHMWDDHKRYRPRR